MSPVDAEPTHLPGRPCPLEALDQAWLMDLAAASGADAAGVVETGRDALRGDWEAFGSLLPGVQSAVAILVRVNPEAVRSPWMGVANRGVAFANRSVDDAASELSQRLLAAGVRSVPVQGSFPMDVQKWPGKTWPISHKTLAEQAGLGRMGHHRLLIHPEYGTAVVLAAVLLDRPVSAYGAPLAANPCNGCKLCVAACPTGSIRADGTFSFVNCATHNYRYRLGGFNDWVETLADSRDRQDYRRRVRGEETISMWQSLAYGANHTCMNCLAVCPAGRAVAVEGEGAAQAPRGRSLVRHLLERGGPVHVMRGSDAEAHASRQFPPERIRRVRSGNRLTSAQGFLQALPLAFQPGRSEGLEATYHFTFTGPGACQGTVRIRDGKVTVKPGLEGEPDVAVTADGPTWLAHLAGEKRLLPALLTRRIRIKGSPALMKAFTRCFPS